MSIVKRLFAWMGRVTRPSVPVPVPSPTVRLARKTKRDAFAEQSKERNEHQLAQQIVYPPVPAYRPDEPVSYEDLVVLGTAIFSSIAGSQSHHEVVDPAFDWGAAPDSPPSPDAGGGDFVGGGSSDSW